MVTMNISLPQQMKKRVDSRVEEGEFGSASGYVRALIRRDLAKEELRALLLEGLHSPVTGVIDEAWFKKMRAIAEGRR